MSTLTRPLSPTTAQLLERARRATHPDDRHAAVTAAYRYHHHQNRSTDQ